LAQLLRRQWQASGIQPKKDQVEKRIVRPVANDHSPDSLVLKCGQVVGQRLVGFDVAERLAVQIASKFEMIKCERPE